MAARIEETQPDKVAAPRKKTLQILTIVVPAVAGVLGTFITVLPQLRNKDVAIGDLQEQVSQLKSNLVTDSKGKPPAEASRRLQITGTVTDSSGKPVSWAEVYLVPQNKPKLIGHTEADGSFRFPDMPDQRYRIVVRDADSGKMNVGDIDEDMRVTNLKWAMVRYHVEK